MKALTNTLLWLLLCGSLALTWQSAREVMQNPALTPLIERSAAEIVALTDRLVAREATPERLDALIRDRLAEHPRNWVALQGLAEVAAERRHPLPAAYGQAWEEESGLVAAAQSCSQCMWDIAACGIETALLCKAPILLTPVDDLRGVLKAGVDYVAGQDVDQLDLGLSIIGLGATGALVATGGSSASIKAGTATIRLARGMGRLSPALTARLSAGLTEGIRWADVPRVRAKEDVARLLRADVLRPVADTLTDLGRVAAELGPVQALHLLPLVDDATDARRLAQAAQALGPKTVSRAEVLGKSRLLRATVRVTDTAIGLIAGVVGAMMSAAMMLAGAAHSVVLRLLRRALVT